MNIEQVKEDLKALENGEELYFNMVQGGGALAVKVQYDWFALFEIPIYGGAPMDGELFHENGIDKMIKKALSWT